MKASSKNLLALTAGAVLSLAHPASANLITNGGFETGDFTGWTQSGDLDATGVIGTDFGIAPHSGSWQASLGPVGSNGFLTQTLTTTAGATYRIDFWLANVGGTPSFFGVNWGGTTVFSLTDAPAFGYTEYSFNVTATSASTAFQFVFRQDPFFWFLDDVGVNQLSRQGVPDGGSTFSLLGVALLGLATLRRKLSC